MFACYTNDLVFIWDVKGTNTSLKCERSADTFDNNGNGVITLSENESDNYNNKSK